VRVIAPLRDKVWTRDEEIDYAQARGIPVTVTQSSPFSFDENLFGRSIEAGVLEDPWEAPPEEPYLLTADPDTAPEPTEVVIGSRRAAGVARRRVARHDRSDLRPQPAGGRLRDRADRHDREPRDRDQEPRGLRGAGGDDADRRAPRTRGHRADEGRAERQARDRGHLGAHRLRRLWFSPLREALDAFVARTQALVTGEVRVQLCPAAAIVNGRRSEFALYAESLASYATGETFPHDAAEGFIRLASLEGELAAVRARTVRV
jgi:argininosuccinate synthase